MRLTADLTKEYGLALEGGGAKGAYQIGVFRALKEAGMRIRAVAGVSVGALNAALICQDDLPRAWKLWESISPEELLGRGVLKSDGRLDLKQIIRQRGIDTALLRKLIQKEIDADKIRQADCACYAAAFSTEHRRQLIYDVRRLPAHAIADMLLASAYYPAFRRARLVYGHFLDGALLDKVPADLLELHGVKNILAIRIYGVGINRTPFLKRKPGITYTEIAPGERLGGMLDFSQKKLHFYLKLGYFDGLRFLYGLSGEKYYFDCEKSEKVCYNIQSMEKLGMALKIPRFRIYQPQAFLDCIKAAQEKG